MQVLLGLQSNALKFTETGRVEIEVSIDEKPNNGSQFLKVSVIDTGIGIPHEHQDKLFKLFGFINNSAQMNTNGIGLGLVISDQIVHQFDGSITFESEPNVGSTFTFTFMLNRIDESQINFP